jgi:hypothetical protein
MEETFTLILKYFLLQFAIEKSCFTFKLQNVHVFSNKDQEVSVNRIKLSNMHHDQGHEVMTIH